MTQIGSFFNTRYLTKNHLNQDMMFVTGEAFAHPATVNNNGAIVEFPLDRQAWHEVIEVVPHVSFAWLYEKGVSHIEWTVTEAEKWEINDIPHIRCRVYETPSEDVVMLAFQAVVIGIKERDDEVHLVRQLSQYQEATLKSALKLKKKTMAIAKKEAKKETLEKKEFLKKIRKEISKTNKVSKNKKK